ncbi:ABC transporter permease [Streptomyces sp. TRM66268-LWL]|uniref:ABC transporter permease n=1 Tax=Streptomyces polyasparticus TaxID=2767826 RepID=A0ABR7SRB1_9ACTN|nr:FtsX-like permease family protein [Streptomyces polyasparticus]MBC9718057.1 ABC transporter permease [Streptomyces polyasparticus]
MAPKAVAPWVRTRLRAAPHAAAAVGALVLTTSFLTAVFPRAVDAYETGGLRAAVNNARPEQRAIEVSVMSSDQGSLAQPGMPAGLQSEVLGLLPPALAPDRAGASHGVETVRPWKAPLNGWLPRRYGAVAPRFTLAAQAEVASHSRTVEGRLPRGEGITARSTATEAAVTEQTARTLNIEVGAVINFQKPDNTLLSVRVTGIVEPLDPQGSYWSHEPVLRTPTVAADDAITARNTYWHGGLLLAPEAAPFLLTADWSARVYTRVPPRVGSWDAAGLPALERQLASLTSGPLHARLTDIVSPEVSVTTGLGELVTDFRALRSAITPITRVAVYGIAAVALVVVLMTGALLATRRAAELSLLRSRGGSLRGIAGRVCAETAVVAVPAAAAGWLLAVAVRPEGALGPSLLASAAVAVLVCVALPLLATARHRRVRGHLTRGDLVAARPSPRRTVVELTVLALAVAAVLALRRQGTGSGSDALVSAAPVLVALIAAVLLVRLYPLPLRIVGRPLGRGRGAVGFLSLARAGHASTTQALPLLALIVALTTAAFGGSVPAGVENARDRAALEIVGADVRVDSRPKVPLPDSLVRQVGALDGIDAVASAYIEYELVMPSGKPVALIAVDPQAYARIAAATGLGTFSAKDLTAPASGAQPALVSASVAQRLGTAERAFRVPAGEFTMRVAGLLDTTPALRGLDFILIDASRLEKPTHTVLLANGTGYDKKALEKAVGADTDLVALRLRAEERAALTDSPLQTGAEAFYSFAVAAGAGYAALTVLLALLQAAPERTQLVARLRTMGLGKGQARRLLVLEALPQALLAAAGGTLVAMAAISLLAPGLDLGRIALATRAQVFGDVRLRVDYWSLLLPASAVVLLAVGVAAGQAWWTARHTSLKELMAGESR